MDITRLLLATHNAGKLAEFVSMIGDMDVRCLTLDDVGIDYDIEEVGQTLLENARLKAEGYARLSGLLTLADDTGLEIDALGGLPGIYPARYGGDGLSAEERWSLVLKQLSGVKTERRGARFRCVVALADPNGLLTYAEGELAGRIALEPAGTHGFGYDPIFHVPAYGKTLAELGPTIKHQISHRAVAVQRLLPEMRELMDTRGDR